MLHRIVIRLVAMVMAIAALPCAVQALSIGEAVDNETLAWGTSAESDAPWFVQTEYYATSGSAARSGAIDDGENSDLTATVVGPGTLRFRWKVSCEGNPGDPGMDALVFWYDDRQGARGITGEWGWGETFFKIPAGSHTLVWRYQKDAAGSAGLDAGFLDQVVWTPEPEYAMAKEVGQLLWSKVEHMGIGNNYMRGVEFDSEGNLVVAGFFQTAGTTASSSDAHIMAVTPDGESVVWEDVFDSNLTDSVDAFFGVKRDTMGNLYAVGVVNGVWPPYQTATLIRKYDAAGGLLWDRRYYSGPWGEAFGIDLDSAQDIYSAGRDFGSWGSQEGQWCILKYSSAGVLQAGYPVVYNYSPSLDCPDIATDIVVESAGRFYAVGYIGIRPSNTYDWHVRAYDANRNLRWSDTISGPGTGNDNAWGAVLDGAGHLYVCGQKWDGTRSSVHVVKYLCDPGGSAAVRVWEKSYASDFSGKSGIAYSMALAPDGALYVAGALVDSADLNQAVLYRLHPETGDVLGRQLASESNQSLVFDLVIEGQRMGFVGYHHNGADWDYLYGMMVLPPWLEDRWVIY